MSEDLEKRDNTGRTPLMRACEEGDLEEAQRLIDKGANIEARDKWGWTPLMWACVMGHEPIVRLLIDKGANIESRAMQLAAQKGHASIVELLFRAGGDINDNQGGRSTASILPFFAALINALSPNLLK